MRSVSASMLKRFFELMFVMSLYMLLRRSWMTINIVVLWQLIHQLLSNRYKLITNVRSSLMAVNIHITIIELNALHTKRQNLFQELDAVIHLLMEAKHWGLRSEERRVGKECRSRWSP